jgi:hypothetical protein
MTNQIRHPELVSGSILPLHTSVCGARWMLKQVQHDVGGNASLRPLRLCVNPNSRRPSAGWGLSRLSVKWFAQRHEGTKRLLRVFVSSCELKSFYARQYRTMGSRFRGNDNVGVLGRVNGYARHPELVCASTPAAPGSISPLAPSVRVARWMLKRVQHDVGNNLPPYFRRPSAGWGLSRLSAKWFAQRHEGIKKLLRVFVSSCELKSFYARQYRTMGSRFRGNDNVGVLGCVN